MPSRPAPKHVLIHDEIAEAIASGTYAPGQQLPTEMELVRTFKASRPTVARAMQRLASEGLIDRRAGSGTFVRRASSAATKLFGLIIPGLGEKELMQAIFGQMAREAESQHHTLLWGDATDEPGADVGTRAIELAKRYVGMQVAGIFFAPVEFASGKDAANRTVLDLCATNGIAIVLIDRDIVAYPQRSCYDLVGIDNRRAMCTLVSHLIEHGERRIDFVARPLSAPTVSLRLAGYRDALREAGIEPTSDGVHFGDPDDRAFVRRILGNRRERVFVCANDLTAARLMHTLEELGISVPGEVRVSGFDDVAYAHLLRVPLTTVRQPAQAIGAAAVRAMFERLANPDAPGRDILLPTSLVLRRSTARTRGKVRSDQR
ncbi:MAG: GntR family transcriptional regulator [Planctomycetia bacterium]